jgi:hypothetical protein
MTAIVRRPVQGSLQVLIPYAVGNREWLRDACGSGTHVTWVRPAWEVSPLHLRAVVDALCCRFDEVVLIRDHAVGRSQCDTRCLDAALDDCVCACGGTNHGARWLEGYVRVGETTLVEQIGGVSRTYITLRKAAP